VPQGGPKRERNKSAKVTSVPQGGPKRERNKSAKVTSVPQGEKDKQCSTKRYAKNLKRLATRFTLKTGGNVLPSGKSKQFLLHQWHPLCTLVKTPVISHELGKGQIVVTTNKLYPWSFVTQISRNG
jgi:hypothetical protein